MTLLVKTIQNISKQSQFAQTNNYIQHGNTTCLRHTLAVAHYSVRIAKVLGISCKTSDLIRGALLHDYFLYDWHSGKNHLHGFTHPSAALCNACKDFNLTETEKNIIIRHMFPLTVIPPVTREGWIVCMADKWCSLRETFSAHPYKHIERWIALYERTAGISAVKF
ncbi:MAG: HD domain-containing protein [Firmicutes bacterium]|nr:HD domain-containing protein [Bacillota bacterium]